MGDQDPSRMNLDVYDTKEGLWDPVNGALDQPAAADHPGRALRRPGRRDRQRRDLA